MNKRRIATNSILVTDKDDNKCIKQVDLSGASGDSDIQKVIESQVGTTPEDMLLTGPLNLRILASLIDGEKGGTGLPSLKNVCSKSIEIKSDESKFNCTLLLGGTGQEIVTLDLMKDGSIDVDVTERPDPSSTIGRITVTKLAQVVTVKVSSEAVWDALFVLACGPDRGSRDDGAGCLLTGPGKPILTVSPTGSLTTLEDPHITVRVAGHNKGPAHGTRGACKRRKAAEGEPGHMTAVKKGRRVRKSK